MEEAIWNLIKNVPGEFVKYLRQFGEEIGADAFQIAQWFEYHPDELLRFISDCKGQRFDKAIEDLTEAWKASHESPA